MLRWLTVSNVRSDSISSSLSSSRTGRSQSVAKRSMMPPRRAKVPGESSVSTCCHPLVESHSTNSCGSIVAPRVSCCVLSLICRGSASGVRTACIDVTSMRGLASESSTKRLTIARRLASAGSVTSCFWSDEGSSIDSMAGKTSIADDVKSVRSSAKMSASTACGTTTIIRPCCS